ncbi:MAG: hypothetical protein M0Z50_19135 [Planctomycetia bacterium]|nr:hypothetical protein [Planctomycetia bacterium]
MSKRIYISHGDKGGVGKSMIAAVIVERLLRDNEQVSLIEGDPSQPDVGLRYSNDANVKHGQLPLNRAGDAENAVGDLGYWLENEGSDQIVINLPAGASETLDALAPFLREVADALEYDIYVTYSLGKGDTPTAGLIKSLQSGLLHFIDEDKRIVVYPEFQGKPEQFAWFNHADRCTAGIHEIIMPAVKNRNTLNKLLNTRGRISDIIQCGADGWMVTDKIGVKRWLDEAMLSLIPIFYEGE